ncbi:MAG: dihydroneopterin aldolase [Chthoniobacteraceae bacterium]
MPDTIIIDQLELSAHIGVPDEERAVAQRLTVSLRMELAHDFRDLDDDISKTVDYYAVCGAIEALVAERPRRLIETLAEEIATAVLRYFAVTAVEVELRKFILPDTAFVAVRLRRER